MNHPIPERGSVDINSVQSELEKALLLFVSCRGCKLEARTKSPQSSNPNSRNLSTVDGRQVRNFMSPQHKTWRSVKNNRKARKEENIYRDYSVLVHTTSKVKKPYKEERQEEKLKLKSAKKSFKHYKSAAHRILDYQETNNFTKKSSKSVKHKANGVCSCISCWDAKFQRFEEIQKPRRFKKKAWKLKKLEKLNRKQLNVSASTNVNKTE